MNGRKAFSLCLGTNFPRSDFLQIQGSRVSGQYSPQSSVKRFRPPTRTTHGTPMAQQLTSRQCSRSAGYTEAWHGLSAVRRPRKGQDVTSTWNMEYLVKGCYQIGRAPRALLILRPMDYSIIYHNCPVRRCSPERDVIRLVARSALLILSQPFCQAQSVEVLHYFPTLLHRDLSQLLI